MSMRPVERKARRTLARISGHREALFRVGGAPAVDGVLWGGVSGKGMGSEPAASHPGCRATYHGAAGTDDERAEEYARTASSVSSGHRGGDRALPSGPGPRRGH